MMGKLIFIIALFAAIVYLLYLSYAFVARRKAELKEIDAIKSDILNIHRKQKVLNDKLISSSGFSENYTSEIQYLNNEVIQLHKKFIQLHVK
jgi:hypothetical protein